MENTKNTTMIITQTKCLLLSVAFMLLAGFSFSQQGGYSYICPKPGSRYINPEQVICVKAGHVFDQATIVPENIKVHGSKSGIMDIKLKLSNDKKVIFIQPMTHFQFSEKVTIELSANISTIAGLSFTDFAFSFYIDKEDNTILVQEFYDRQLYNDEQILNNLTARNEGKDYNNSNNLPLDYAAPTVNIYEESDDYYIFFTTVTRVNSNYSPYLTIWDKYGVPIYYRKMYGQTLNFYALDNGKLTFGTTTGMSVSENRFYIMNAFYEIIDTADMSNGYDVDMHDFLLLTNGHYLMQSYDVRIIDMSQVIEGGHPNAKVTGLVIQEVDQQQNVYFQWRSWDHFEITDATPDIDLTSEYIDYCHGNTLTIDNDGQLLISCRNMDEITKINFQNGDIIWRWGKWAKNNEFTIIDDPTGFSHQHDIRVLSNGHYTVYDNGNNHFPQVSQAMEYEIDEETMEARLVWHYRHDPEIFAQATGSHQRTASNKSIVGWGYTYPHAITEVRLDGTETFEFFLPENVTGYRSLKYEWETNLFETQDLLDFGSYISEDFSSSKELKVTNNANHTIKITSAHNHLEEFYVDETFPIVFSSGQTQYLTVRFEPEVQGYYEDILTLNSDNNDNTERIARQVKLSGFWDEIPPTVNITPQNGSTNISLDTIVMVFFSEPVRQPGGNLINSSYIQEMFYFKLDDENGENVPFFGVINESHKIIKLIPQDSLFIDQQYYVELIADKVEDRAGNKLSQSEISVFKTIKTVGLSEPTENKTFNIFPNPAQNILNIEFYSVYEGKSEISILDNHGKKIFNKTVMNNQESLKISLEKFNEGIYLIRHASDCFQNTKKLIIAQ